MKLLEQVEALWNEDVERQVSEWSIQLKSNFANIENAISRFNEWTPLYVYTSVDRARKAGLIFSLRYEGRQVALLRTDGNVRIELCKSAIDEFNFESKETSFLWQSQEGRAFRKHFQSLGASTHKVTPERAIESEFLTQMTDKESKKFAGTLTGIQPVQLAKCRFQMPVPFSAHSGKPEATGGGIDILARRRGGNKTRLSVWELKRPKEQNHYAIEQAYIYSVQLIKMLRVNDGSGNTWYRDIFGFNSDVPDKLEIESVVAVNVNNKDEYLAKYQKFKAENPLTINGDAIKLFVAFYEENPLRMNFMEVA